MEEACSNCHRNVVEARDPASQPPTERAVTEDVAVGLLEAVGVGKHSKREGDVAPDVTLFDTHGNPVHLPEVWSQGPLVLIFYRGGWCNYCNIQLRAWAEHAAEVRRLGATLLAVSPQTTENAALAAETLELAYSVLSDSNLEAALGFDIAFTVPPELVDVYASAGTDIPVLNGNRQWVLPVPATYVIDQNGLIRFAHVEADYRVRAEPCDAIAALERMALRRSPAITPSD